MSDQLEQLLREQFATEAERAPIASGLGEAARARVRVARRRRAVLFSGGLAVVVAMGGTVVVRAARTGADAPLASPSVQSASSALRTGALSDGGAASCSTGGSPVEVARRTAFAFDGTVVDIGSGPTSSSVVGPFNYVAVTFAVHEWFHGGSGGTATVNMLPPIPSQTEDPLPSYESGTRLLVAGNPLRGGAPLQDAVAWSCGFTRYYDAQTAGLWRQSTAARH